MKKTIILSIALILVLGLTGCGTKTLVENKMERDLENALGGNVNVDLDGEEMNIETEDGFALQTGESVSLPNDFPSDVYVIEGDIKSVMKNPMGDGYSITIETNESMEGVYKIYQEKLPNDGWVLNAQMNLGEMYLVSGIKEVNSVSVSVSTQDEKTFVVLTVVSEGASE